MLNPDRNLLTIFHATLFVSIKFLKLTELTPDINIRCIFCDHITEPKIMHGTNLFINLHWISPVRIKFKAFADTSTYAPNRESRVSHTDTSNKINSSTQNVLFKLHLNKIIIQIKHCIHIHCFVLFSRTSYKFTGTEMSESVSCLLALFYKGTIFVFIVSVDK